MHEQGLEHSKTLPLPLGPFTPINALAGLMVSDLVADIDETHEQAFQLELTQAKEEGLEAVKRLVGHNSFG